MQRFGRLLDHLDPSPTAPTHRCSSDVVDDGWFATLRALMQDELFQMSSSRSIVCTTDPTINPKQPILLVG
jgi:hypothetical protein